MTRKTGGDLRHYLDFNSSNSAICQKLYGDVRRSTLRSAGYEAVAKLRCSAGLEIVPVSDTSFYGKFFRKSVGSEELYFANIDADNEFVVTLQHDGSNLSVGQLVYLQLALLYTRRDGERVIRVHNLSLKVSDHLPTLFRHASIGATCSFFAKRAAHETLKGEITLRKVRERIVTDSVEVLYKYRSNVATKSSSGQLILPESLKLLAVYMNAFMKGNAIGLNRKGGLVRFRADPRAEALHRTLSMPASLLLGELYPRLVVLHPLKSDSGYGEFDEDIGHVKIPTSTWASSEKVDLDGVYAVHDGNQILVHFGEAISRETAQAYLGQDAEKLMSDPKSLILRPQNNDMSRRVHAILQEIQRMWNVYGRTTPISIANGNLKTIFLEKLVEDRTYRSDTSYIDYLCALHKKIQLRMKTA